MVRSTGLAWVFVFAATLQCLAREPTPEEQADISNKLIAEGYLRWGRMELRSDWVIEGVYRSNGEICDLKVHAENYEIFDKDCD